MATTYVSPGAATGKQPVRGTMPEWVTQEFNIATAVATADNGGGGAGGTGFVVNDVVQMIKVQSGERVLDVILSVDDLDSSTGIELGVGDGGDDDRYITASTIGQAGGLARMARHVGHGYAYTADDTIDIKVTTAATGTAATTGTLRLTALIAPA